MSATTQLSDDCGTIADETDDDIEHPNVFQNAEGRTIADGGGGDLAYISQLTAVAEYGIEAVEEADIIHHALEAGDDIHVNVPEWLVPLERSDHSQLHANEEYETDGGIPLLTPDSDSGDPNLTARRHAHAD